LRDAVRAAVIEYLTDACTFPAARILGAACVRLDKGAVGKEALCWHDPARGSREKIPNPKSGR